MPAFVENFLALLFQRQAIDFNDVVEHSGENGDDVLISVPVETGFFRERVLNELREVDRAKQARTVRGERLLAARVRGPDVLAKPVVVHLVRPIDQDEARFGVVVGGRHDHVPQALGADFPINLAGDLPDVVDDQTFRGRPLAPDDLVGVV